MLMETTAQSSGRPPVETPSSKKAFWAGRVASGLVVAFLALDGVMKLVKPKPVTEAFVRTGWPVSLAVPLGVILLACVALYVIPRTAVLGAIVLTAWLGGAVATHLRIGDPLFSHVLFPVYVGILLWGGLFLREPRLRSLIPLRSSRIDQ